MNNLIEVYCFSENPLLINNLRLMFSEKPNVSISCFSNFTNVNLMNVNFIVIDENLLEYELLVDLITRLNSKRGILIKKSVGITLLSDSINLTKYTTYYENGVVLINNKVVAFQKQMFELFYFQLNSLFVYCLNNVRDFYQIKDMYIDLNAKSVYINNVSISALSYSEFLIIETLVQRHNEAVSKDELLRIICPNVDKMMRKQKKQEKVIDVIICNLRKKLSKYSDQNYIDTVWKKGYMMSDGDTAESIQSI